MILDMKKIILAIMIASTSFSVLSQMTFNMTIPQPDFVSNDWDNDGLPNAVDNDDDGDGIDDENDSTPFGQSGQNSTPNVIFNSFTSNKITIDPNESFNLFWSFENPRDLLLYDDVNKLNLISDVTGLTTLSLNNINTDTTFYLDYITDSASLDIFTWINNGTSCGSYSPLESTVNSGTTFTQSRTCTTNYISNEPNSKSTSYTQNKQSTGTKVVRICRGDASNYTVYYNGGLDFIWNGSKIGRSSGFSSITYQGKQYFYSPSSFGLKINTSTTGHSYKDAWKICQQ
jgi:hypothetical protein